MTRTEFLSFSPPAIGPTEREEVMDTLQSTWITTGPKTKAFEGRLQEYFASPAVVALNSCTAGLHVGLLAMGIQPGDEVIVPTMTFCATANVVEHVGARPVLVDISGDTLNIDPAAAERAVTSRTRAIVPVHYAGHPVDLDAIFALASRHGLQVMEDAAHAISAEYRGVKVGARSNLAAFSFYATKNLTTGEGGCLTGDAGLVDRARILGHHGMNRDAWKRFDQTGSWYYEVVVPGFKYNMTDVQASLGLRQLDRLAQFQERRREIVELYHSGFGAMPEIERPIERDDVLSSWHLYVIKLNLERLRLNRNAFIEELKSRNIGTSVHYLPAHMHPFYRGKYGYQPADCPVAARMFDRIISLPLHPLLTNDDVADVVEAVRDIVSRHRA